MPILMTTPDMTAETWLGATGCAIGSQMCSGMIPHLEPKPKSASRKTALRKPGESDVTPARMVVNEVVKSAPESNRNMAISATNPACIMAKYHTPARTVPRRSCSVRTSQ